MSVDVKKKWFQLVGISALFLAQKFEEIHPRRLDTFVESADYAYSKTEIMNLER